MQSLLKLLTNLKFCMLPANSTNDTISYGNDNGELVEFICIDKFDNQYGAVQLCICLVLSHCFG